MKMIGAVGFSPSFFSVAGNVSNIGNGVSTSTSVISSSSLVETGGLTKEGVAFLALLAMADDEEKKLTLAQRMALLAVLLGAVEHTNLLNINTFSMSMSASVDSSGMLLGYESSGASVSASPVVGALFNASI